jgi:hypothetical protein
MVLVESNLFCKNIVQTGPELTGLARLSGFGHFYSR